MAPTQPYAIAVDLGGTNLRVAAFNAGFERLETRAQATQVSGGAAAAVEKLCQCVEEMTARRGPPLGVGIAFPGQVDGESGRIRIAATGRDARGSGPHGRSSGVRPAGNAPR